MFQESSLVFHGSLKSVSSKYHGTFKDAASGSFKGDSEKISRVFQVCFTGDSRSFQRPCKQVSRGSLTRVSIIFQGSFIVV